MEQRLSVIIEADVKRFNQALAQAEKNLKNAESVFRRSTGEVSRLENALAKLSNQFKAGAISEKDFQKQAEAVSKALLQQRTVVQNSQSEIKRLGSAINSIQASRATTQTGKLGGQMSKLTGQVRGANSVALEFNRIIQDAPFGLIGIGNNLQQLAGNFSNVSKAAGGTGKAIVASLSALFTPANIALLAVSALTAGFTAYQMGAFDFASASKKAAKEADDFAQGLEDFKKSLDAVSKAQLQGAKDAQKEIVNLKALRTQAENTNLTQKQRLAAVKELQKIAPDYLGILSDEQILTGDVGDAYEKLTKNLQANAIARAANAKVTENSIKIFDLEERALSRVNKILEARNRIEKLQKLDNQTAALKVAGQVTAQNNDLIRAKKELEELQLQQVTDITEVGKIQEENNRLTDRYVKALEEGASIVDLTTNQVEQLGKAFQEVGVNVGEIDFQDLAKRIKEGYQNASAELDADGGIINIPVKVDLVESEYDKEILSKNDAIIAKTKAMEQVISQTGIQISNSFANAFAQGLDSGENFFDSLEKGFKALLKQLAAQLAAAAFLKILAGLTTGGISTAFAGAAASNPLGALFGGFKASGGPVQSGKSYVVGEQGPEMFIPKTSGTIIPNDGMAASTASTGGGAITVNVVGKIMNDAIVLSNQRGSRANNRYYGINE